MIRRRHDWPERLHDYLDSIRGKSFVWGAEDCCLVPANCVQAMTGVDPAAWFRGRYETALGAVRLLREFSGGGLLRETGEKIARDMGWPEIDRSYIQRGDYALISNPPDDESGLDCGMSICVGPKLVVMSVSGLAWVPISRAIKAWRV